MINAFVSSSAIGATSFTTTTAKRCPMRLHSAVRCPSKIPRATMATDDQEEDDGPIFLLNGPQGWTPYAERVNGWLAMLGFTIGLVTELVSGRTMGEQLWFLFGWVANLGGISFAVLGMNFFH